jgi:hypothetical protein
MRTQNHNHPSTTPPFVDALEPRQFLSVTPAVTAPILARPALELGVPFFHRRRPTLSTSGGILVGHYTGTLTASGKNTFVERDMVLNITDQIAGRVDGWAFIDGVGLYQVTGSVAGGKRVSLLFNSSTGGGFRGNLSLTTQTISGKFLGPVGDVILRGTIEVTRDGPAIRLNNGSSSGGSFFDNTPSHTDGNPVPGLGNPVPGLGNPVPGFGR